MSTYFSKTNRFIPAAWRDDGTYSPDAWPSDAVLLTDEEEAEYRFGAAPDGMVLGSDEGGRPIWVAAPEPVLTYAEELAMLNSAYVSGRDALCAAWLRAAVADGMNEGERKADVEAELNDLDAQHAVDVAAIKAKYGVE